MKRPLTLVYVLTLALNVIAEKKVLSVGKFRYWGENIYLLRNNKPVCFSLSCGRIASSPGFKIFMSNDKL